MQAYDDNPGSDYLKVALEAAQRAADISRKYYAGNFDVRIKADRTPVTQADVECEQAISSHIREHFPEHGFYGEETGQSQMDADYLWLVDPIDGTKGFLRGDQYAVALALIEAGQVQIGVLGCPGLVDGHVPDPSAMLIRTSRAGRETPLFRVVFANRRERSRCKKPQRGRMPQFDERDLLL